MDKKQVTVHFSKELHKQIKVQAAEEGTNVSAIIEKLLTRYLEFKSKQAK